MKKLKTLKDIYDVSKQSYVSAEAEEVVEDLRKMIKEWIEFLEVQGAIAATSYPRGFFQAEILKEIFDIGDKNENNSND